MRYVYIAPGGTCAPRTWLRTCAAAHAAVQLMFFQMSEA